MVQMAMTVVPADPAQEYAFSRVASSSGEESFQSDKDVIFNCFIKQYSVKQSLGITARVLAEPFKVGRLCGYGTDRTLYRHFLMLAQNQRETEAMLRGHWASPASWSLVSIFPSCPRSGL